MDNYTKMPPTAEPESVELERKTREAEALRKVRRDLYTSGTSIQVP